MADGLEFTVPRMRTGRRTVIVVRAVATAIGCELLIVLRPGGQLFVQKPGEDRAQRHNDTQDVQPQRQFVQEGEHDCGAEHQRRMLRFATEFRG